MALQQGPTRNRQYVGGHDFGAQLSDPWSGARNAGLLRGAYHFFHPGIDPVEQAEFFATARQAYQFGKETLTAAGIRRLVTGFS